MAGPSIFNTAYAGLQAAQAGLLVTSQNISGASVEGYTRRDASAIINRLAPHTATATGTGFSPEGFIRDYSRLLENQRLGQQGKYAYSDTLVQTTAALDKLVADESNSIATVISEFFDAAGQMVGDPTSPAYRANLAHKAEMVSQRIVGLSETLSRVDGDARKALETTLAEANAYTEQLAQVNAKIKEGTAAEAGIGPAPEYLDERDRLLMRLQKLVGGQTVINTDQTATHYMNGIPLVEGGIANKFNVVNTEGNIDNLKITFTSYTQASINASDENNRIKNQTMQTVATELFQSGEAGAYVELVRNFLPDLNRRLDSIAIGLLKTVNDLSPNPMFGFEVSDGALKTNTADDTYLADIPNISSATQIYEVRDMLDPSDPSYVDNLSQLRAANFRAVAPENVDDWIIDADDAYAIEALRGIFSDPVSDLVATTGSQIATWTNNRAADKSVMEILNSRREEVSGVNLDEEAANMVKFQQLYAASSKIIQTGKDMFDTLLSMVSR